jgi:hypothetical protein
MTKLNVTVDHGKCQGYGACVKIAPEVFRLNADNKADSGDPAGRGCAQGGALLSLPRGHRQRCGHRRAAHPARQGEFVILAD